MSAAPAAPPQHFRHDDGLPALLWRFDAPVITASTGPLGGGVTRSTWVLNATVESDYRRTDPAVHLAEIAGGCGVDPARGAALMTAVDVGRVQRIVDGDLTLWATVGRGADKPDLTRVRAAGAARTPVRTGEPAQ